MSSASHAGYEEPVPFELSIEEGVSLTAKENDVNLHFLIPLNEDPSGLSREERSKLEFSARRAMIKGLKQDEIGSHLTAIGVRQAARDLLGGVADAYQLGNSAEGVDPNDALDFLDGMDSKQKVVWYGGIFYQQPGPFTQDNDTPDMALGMGGIGVTALTQMRQEEVRSKLTWKRVASGGLLITALVTSSCEPPVIPITGDGTPTPGNTEQPQDTQVKPTLELPTQKPTDVPTEQPTDTPEPTATDEQAPEATLEVQSERKFEDVIALEKAMQEAGPGEIVMDPDRNANGQLTVLKDNEHGVHDYFLESFLRINKESIDEFNSKYNQDITDLDSFKAYLKENNWILPEVDSGYRLLKGEGDYVIAKLGTPIKKAICLKNLGAMRVGLDEYNFSIANYNNPDQLIKNGTLMYPNQYYPDAAVKIGFGRHLVKDEKHGEYFQIYMQVVLSEEYEISGFPSNGELTAKDKEEIDRLFRVLLYTMNAIRPWHDPPMTFMHYQPSINSYKSSGGIDNKGYAQMLGIADLYKEFKTQVSGDNYPYDVSPAIIDSSS